MSAEVMGFKEAVENMTDQIMNTLEAETRVSCVTVTSPLEGSIAE